MMLARFVLIILCMSVSAAYADETVTITQEAAKKLPAIQFKDEGGLFPLDPTSAKLTIVHFWATWCVPCAAELPQVDATSAAYGGKGLRIIAVSMDGRHMERIQQFFDEHHISQLKPYLDDDDTAFHAFDAPGLPTSIFIDQKGNEIARAEGPIDWEDKATKDFIEKHLR